MSLGQKDKLTNLIRNIEPMRLYFLAAGFLPIASLSAAIFGFAPLHLMVRYVLLPATLLTVFLGARSLKFGRLALWGFGAGIVATGVYDVARFGFILAGAWTDFIPTIGKLALDDPGASPLWGYAYRYFYDGGAMGI